jgi:thiol-disulfide isomerase/thioredoxin
MSTTPTTSHPDTSLAQRLRNFAIVGVAVVLAIAILLGLQTRTPSASLSDMAKAAVPLEQALTNGKPTFMEFYANWCTSCQAMAPSLQQLKGRYQDQVNFVMLNVDNSKWLPEMLHYRVDGIPHFAFLTPTGNDLGSAIGEVPNTILAENLDALIAGQPLPHAKATGQTSAVEAALTPSNSATDDPRSHSAQVTPN